MPNLRHLLLLAALVAPTVASNAAPQTAADLEVSISGLRNDKGSVMLCLTRRPQQQFLECSKDPARKTQVVRAAGLHRVEFRGLDAGDYSLLVIHDENGNGKLDKMMGIPREGFGFSRNPAIRMGPPRYEEVHFAVRAAGQVRQPIKLKYLL